MARALNGIQRAVEMKSETKAHTRPVTRKNFARTVTRNFGEIDKK